MRGTGLLAILLLLAAAGCSTSSSSARRPPNWPDLTVLTNYPNPFGDTCSDDGTTSSGRRPSSEHVEENHLKNRSVPPPSYTPYSVRQMLDLPSGDSPNLDDSGAALTGYVLSVKPGGTEGESCNCEARFSNEVDAHIEVAASPQSDTAGGKGLVIVEVTERSRRLADAGLLSSNIGNDWSTRQLERRLTGHWVRFFGWLMFDPDHAEESWSVDPSDSSGRRNWRGTPWEVHPVMGIEVLATNGG